MNIFSKILIVVFISISLKSISAQYRTDSISADGIVTVIRVTADVYFSQGTGFFIDPHTLVTVFHAIDGVTHSLGKVSDQLFIVHPETEEWIPVHLIQSLDFINDIAVLHIKDYESPVYYELFEGSKESLFSSNAYVFGRDIVSSYKLEGSLSSQNSSKVNIKETLSLFTLLEEPRYKLSGSPVFSMDDKVIGVYSGNEGSTLHNRVVFSDVQNLKELLLRPSLNCMTEICVQREFSDAKRSKEGRYALGIYHLNMFVVSADHKQRLRHKKRARRWFKKSAKKGFPLSMYQLALIYRALDKDIERFAEWMEKAAEYDYGYAQLEWSLYLLNEKGDIEEGIKWAKGANENGYWLPLYNLEDLVDNQLLSWKEYIQHLEDFSNQEHSFAQAQLALHLFEGDILEQDTNKAMKLLLQAVEANNGVAIGYLSVIYEKGLYGFEPDIDRAHSLKQRAMDLGLDTEQ